MSLSPYGRSLALLIAGVAVAALSITLWLGTRAPAPAPPETKSAEEVAPPSLNCVFYDFTRASVVVAFDFAVTLADGKPPRFAQRSISARDGTQTVFDAGERPDWPYAPDEEGTPVITSPDGAIRIVLYGLKIGTGGVFFIEAGLRSNEYRNLQGQCRQTNLGGAKSSGEASAGGAAAQN